MYHVLLVILYSYQVDKVVVMGRSETRSASVNARTTEDPSEELITRVCSNFIKQLDDKMNEKFNKLGSKIDNLTTSLKTLDSNVVENTEAIRNLNKMQDRTEQLLKRNSIRIEGLTEVKNENTVHLVTEFLQKTLKINCNENDIDSAYRIESSHKNAIPRPTLVRFVTNHKKNEVFNAKKCLKQSKISIFEDLTRSRYSLLKAAKKKYGSNHAWSMGGRIFVLKDNKKSEIISIDDI